MPGLSVPSVPPSPFGRPRNRLLASLPSEDYLRILPELRAVSMKPRQVLHRAGEPIADVYFPNGGVTSIATLLSDGSIIEATTVGSEGMVGVEAFLTSEPIAPGETLVQVPDTSTMRMSVEAFRREIERRGALYDRVGRYVQLLIAQIMQIAGCNASHHVQERCCRWMLMTHDRIGGDEFDLSHELLGVMLGVRRQTVTVVAGGLQRAGLIRYRHGHVTILDRSGLESASCECYGMIRGQYERLFASAT